MHAAVTNDPLYALLCASSQPGSTTEKISPRLVRLKRKSTKLLGQVKQRSDPPNMTASGEKPR